MSSGLPKHIAIIMDGNGRWAERRGRPRIYGHIKGCGRVREIIREADRLGIKQLTLYAFSTENWGRPTAEVTVLMQLLKKWLIRERRELIKRNIRFRAIGNLERLPMDARKLVRESEELSAGNTGLELTFALSYSGRDEIIDAAKSLARRAMNGELLPEDINQEIFSMELDTVALRDPDLLIRTSGEQRISNFMLWQMAYTEFYFTDTMWPDFRAVNLRLAIDSYTRRERRFGLTSSKIEATI